MRTLKLIVPIVLVTTAMVPSAQVAAGGQAMRATAPAAAAPIVPAAVPTPPDYIIGPDDLLAIVFWRDKDMSSEVAVRPDGKISLPLLNDVQAAGLTPPQLRDRLTELSQKYPRRPERHDRRPSDQQQEGIHHWSGQQGRHLSAQRADHGPPADRDGGRYRGVRARQEDCGNANGERPSGELSVQL